MPEDLKQWIDRLFQVEELLRMGHAQRKADSNLGLGWIYYGLARVLRPERVVVIGSWRGFVPAVLARALADNQEGGELLFIDPSLADDFWKDPSAVAEHFRSLGVPHVRHFLHTTQDFVRTREYRDLNGIGMLFVDGYHTREQARIDFEAFAGKLAPQGIALFHDTANRQASRRYGEEGEYQRDVYLFTQELESRSEFQVFDLPFASGVTLVRRRVESSERSP